MTVTSGRRLFGLLHSCDPLGAFSRMLLASSGWDWTMCSLTWKASATPRGRLMFRLVASERITTGSASGLWPTPQAMDAMRARGEGAMLRQMTGPRRGRKKIATMKDAAVYGLHWEGAAKRLGSGELSPRRLEWMMGYPDGWTDTGVPGTGFLETPSTPGSQPRSSGA